MPAPASDGPPGPEAFILSHFIEPIGSGLCTVWARVPALFFVLNKTRELSGFLFVSQGS